MNEKTIPSSQIEHNNVKSVCLTFPELSTGGSIGPCAIFVAPADVTIANIVMAGLGGVTQSDNDTIDVAFTNVDEDVSVFTGTYDGNTGSTFPTGTDTISARDYDTFANQDMSAGQTLAMSVTCNAGADIAIGFVVQVNYVLR